MFWVKGATERENKRHRHMVCVMLFGEATKTSSIVYVFIISQQLQSSLKHKNTQMHTYYFEIHK